MSETTTILYVDDEPLNVMLFQINFKRHYNVITATSGSEALEKLQVNKDIKVVLSDMKMPEMDGIEFITKAKKAYPHIQFFILTGYGMIEEIATAMNDNVIQDCFRKPFNLPEIGKALKKVCNNDY